MSINEFQSVGNKAPNLISQVKVDTGYKTRGLLDEYYARKNELEEKQDEIERTITDDDGETEKPSALDYITASLTGIAGVLSSAAPLLQGNGGSSGNAGGGSAGGASAANDPASKLDSAVEAYNKKASTKNKVALDKCLGEANAELAKVNEKIEPLETENASLQKALDGNFKDVFTSLKDGAKACKETRDKADAQVKMTDDNITAVITAIADNTDKKATVSGLQKETNGKIVEITNGIDVKVVEKAQQEDTLKSLSKDYQKAVGDIREDENAINTAEKNINTANGNVEAAKQDLIEAEAMGTTSLDKDGKQVKDSKKVEARNNAIESAKEKQKAAEKELKDAQDEKKAAEDRKAEHEKQKMDCADKIQVGEQTLGDIIRAKETAEAQRDEAQAQLNDYATQLKGYIDEDKQLGERKNTLETEQKKNNALIDDLINSDDEFKNLQVNAEEGKATAQAKLDKNNQILKPLKEQQSKLNNSITKAEQAGAKLSDGVDKAEVKPTPAGSTPAADGSAKPAATGGTPDDKPAANGDKKTPTVEEFKASDDYAEFENNWKANNNGQAPNEADIERWIKENINN